MPSRFCFKDTLGSTYVPLSDIVRFEADGNYTKAYLNSKEVNVICSCLCEQDKRVMDSGLFFRIHKSHIINIQYVKRICNNGTVVMADGTQLPISPREKA